MRKPFGAPELVAHIAFFKIEGLQGFWANAFHIPVMEELMCKNIQLFVGAGKIVGKADHSGIAVLHTIAIYIRINAGNKGIGAEIVRRHFAKNSLLFFNKAFYFSSKGAGKGIGRFCFQRQFELLAFTIRIFNAPLFPVQVADFGWAIHQIL